MSQRIFYLVKLYLTLFLIFIPEKIIFMLVNMSHADGAPFGSCLAVLWHGLRLDSVTACYVLILPLLILVLSVFFKKFALRKVLALYYILVSLFLAAVFIADTVLYFFWGAKLDANELMYATNPSEMLNDLNWIAIIVVFALLGLLTWLFFRLMRWATPVKLDKLKNKWSALLLIPVAGLLFLGMRGSVTQSSANQSFAYFSEYPFCNHAALNPAFNLMRSGLKAEDLEHEFDFMSDDECAALVGRSFEQDNAVTDTLLRCQRPDILLIIWEGASWNVAMNDSVGPNLMRFANEGVNFTRCYANSFRTDRGVLCLLSGWMGLPTTSLMKMNDMCQRLPGLPRELANIGYDSRFVFGGDIDFTNMRGYLHEIGYGTVLGSSYFPDSHKLSTWGAPDQYTLQPSRFVFGSGIANSKPCFNTILTISSHEPWKVPMQRLTNERLNAFAYSDSCIGVLVDSLRSSLAWDSLLVIIVPDHGIPFATTDGMSDPAISHIPMVWTGGAVKGHRNLDMYMAPSDMAATLLAQLSIYNPQLSSARFPLSRNVLSPSYPSRHPFAIHTFKNGFNFIDSTGITRFDCGDCSAASLSGQPHDINMLKAILQHIYKTTARLKQNITNK